MCFFFFSVLFFFFKKKSAYDIGVRLVGSEMCIRDRLYTDCGIFTCNENYGEDATAVFNMLSGYSEPARWNKLVVAPIWLRDRFICLLYTSDAADEEDSADLGCRRIIKKNKKKKKQMNEPSLIHL